MVSYSNHKSCISGIQQLDTVLVQYWHNAHSLMYLFVGFESPIQKIIAIYWCLPRDKRQAFCDDYTYLQQFMLC